MDSSELAYISSLFLHATRTEKYELCSETLDGILYYDRHPSITSSPFRDAAFTTFEHEISSINAKSSKILHKYYHRHTISKKRGGTRNLYEPNKTLKKIQRRINDDILKKIPVSDYAFAYVPERSILNNAKPHVKNPILLKLDIHRFFDNIHFQSVFGIFIDAGYSVCISKLFAKLATIDDFLPQGAPTSPALSNIYLRGFDEEIGQYCKKKGIVYTRYSDDLTFSMQHFDSNLVKVVKEKLEILGLELNKKKSKVISGPLQKRVTGIVVNEKPQAPIDYRRKIRQEMYFISKFGLAKHLKHEKVLDKEAYIRSLRGRIDFVLQANKDDSEFQEYKATLLTLASHTTNLRSQLEKLLD